MARSGSLWETVVHRAKASFMVKTGQNQQTEKRLTAVPAFRGNHAHTIDEKGRVSLPVEFRRILSDNGENGVVITNFISDGARCLEGFGLKAWQEFETKLKAKSRFGAKLQKLENYYLSRAAECPIDGTGRILLPAYLRLYAGIERDVTFTSSIHGFRIWDTRVWTTIFAAAEEALMSNPDVFADVDVERF